MANFFLNVLLEFISGKDKKKKLEYKYKYLNFNNLSIYNTVLWWKSSLPIFGARTKLAEGCLTALFANKCFQRHLDK